MSADSAAYRPTAEVPRSPRTDLPAAETHSQDGNAGSGVPSAGGSWTTGNEEEMPLGGNRASEHAAGTNQRTAEAAVDSFLSPPTAFNEYSLYKEGGSADRGAELTRRRNGTEDRAVAAARRDSGVGDRDTLQIRGGRFGAGGQDNITVRPYRSADAEAVKKLCHRHFRSLTLPSVFFWICHHSFDLLALFVIALFFAPLQRVLLGGLMFFGYLLLRGVWEFEMYIRHDCPDLNNIKESYMRNRASGFWVAERTEGDSRGCSGVTQVGNQSPSECEIFISLLGWFK